MFLTDVFKVSKNSYVLTDVFKVNKNSYVSDRYVYSEKKSQDRPLITLMLLYIAIINIISS